jgi:hypothetical protein
VVERLLLSDAVNTTDQGQSAIRWIRIIIVLVGIAWAVWCGCRPMPGDFSKRYDRTILSVGGLILLVAVALELVLNSK